VGFICCAARNLNVVDVQCRLAAILDPYLRYHVVQMDQESLLLEALQPPISRGIWDNVIKCHDIQLLLSTLAERIESRKTGKDWIPHPAEINGPIKTVRRQILFYSIYLSFFQLYLCLFISVVASPRVGRLESHHRGATPANEGDCVEIAAT
jgi:hypothetical protein